MSRHQTRIQQLEARQRESFERDRVPILCNLAKAKKMESDVLVETSLVPHLEYEQTQ